MNESRKANSVYILAMVCIVGAIAALLAFASTVASRAALVSPEEQQARAAFRANWQALSASPRANEAYSARLAGQAAALTASSQRANDAYSARLAGMDPNQRAAAAYAARLTGLAAQANANLAYTARLTGQAQQYLAQAAQRSQAAYSARWQAMAAHYAGQIVPVTGK